MAWPPWRQKRLSQVDIQPLRLVSSRWEHNLESEISTIALKTSSSPRHSRWNLNWSLYRARSWTSKTNWASLLKRQRKTSSRQASRQTTMHSSLFQMTDSRSQLVRIDRKSCSHRKEEVTLERTICRCLTTWRSRWIKSNKSVEKPPNRTVDQIQFQSKSTLEGRHRSKSLNQRRNSRKSSLKSTSQVSREKYTLLMMRISWFPTWSRRSQSQANQVIGAKNVIPRSKWANSLTEQEIATIEQEETSEQLIQFNIHLPLEESNSECHLSLIGRLNEITLPISHSDDSQQAQAQEVHPLRHQPNIHTWRKDQIQINQSNCKELGPTLLMEIVDNNPHQAGETCVKIHIRSLPDLKPVVHCQVLSYLQIKHLTKGLSHRWNR